MQDLENRSNDNQDGGETVRRREIGGKVYSQVGPGSVRNGQRDQFTLGCGGDGTDRTPLDIAGDISGHVGSPVMVLEK